MLRAVLADLAAWGAVRTITTLDDRLSGLALPADEVVRVTPGRHEAVLNSLLAQSEAALIIAPETDGVLARLSALASRAGAVLLGSDPAAVATAGDKYACHQLFRRAGLPTPLTRRASLAAAPVVAREVGYPLVSKPLDGVGCAGVCLVAGEADLPVALAHSFEATAHEELLLQSLVQGTHASVSLLVAQGRALPLSLNGQHIEIGRPFAYRGGVVPLQHPAEARALAVARAAVGLLPGLQGYVGVDLVLSEEEAWLIEINPRLTTSYVALRRVLPFNLAQAIWQACHEGVLPDGVTIGARVSFSERELAEWE